MTDLSTFSYFTAFRFRREELLRCCCFFFLLTTYFVPVGPPVRFPSFFASLHTQNTIHSTPIFLLFLEYTSNLLVCFFSSWKTSTRIYWKTRRGKQRSSRFYSVKKWRKIPSGYSTFSCAFSLFFFYIF